jgi:protein phosphatase 2C family protein 2/3
MQGWRISMEDAHTAELNLPAPDNDTKAHPDRLAFFGVYDGHGGDKVALFAGENIHNIVFKQDSFKSGDYAQGLKDGFLATDRAILSGTHMMTSLYMPLPACAQSTETRNKGRRAEQT